MKQMIFTREMAEEIAGKLCGYITENEHIKSHESLKVEGGEIEVEVEVYGQGEDWDEDFGYSYHGTTFEFSNPVFFCEDGDDEGESYDMRNDCDSIEIDYEDVPTLDELCPRAIWTA